MQSATSSHLSKPVLIYWVKIMSGFPSEMTDVQPQELQGWPQPGGGVFIMYYVLNNFLQQ